MNTEVNASFDINQFLNDYGLWVGVGALVLIAVLGTMIYLLVIKAKSKAALELKQAEKGKPSIRVKNITVTLDNSSKASFDADGDIGSEDGEKIEIKATKDSEISMKAGGEELISSKETK